MTSSAAEVTTRILALNGDDKPFRYFVSDDNPLQLHGVWKFDDPLWARDLGDSRASRSFAFTVILRPENGSYRWSESDAGYQNGRIRAYRGYNRGYSFNIATIFIDMIRQSQARRARNGRPEQHYPLAVMKDPIIATLKAEGWRSRGVTI